jgi:hypothetical protein
MGSNSSTESISKEKDQDISTFQPLINDTSTIEQRSAFYHAMQIRDLYGTSSYIMWKHKFIDDPEKTLWELGEYKYSSFDFMK